MSSKQLPPEIERIVTQLHRRVAALEKLLADRTPPPHRERIEFSYDGPLAAGLSQKWVNFAARTAGDWMCTLVTAGTTDTEIDILLNDVSVLTITIAAGEYSGRSTTLLDIRPGFDQLQAQIVTAGDGAEKLSVQAVAV